VSSHHSKASKAAESIYSGENLKVATKKKRRFRGSLIKNEKPSSRASTNEVLTHIGDSVFRGPSIVSVGL